MIRLVYNPSDTNMVVFDDRDRILGYVRDPCRCERDCPARNGVSIMVIPVKGHMPVNHFHTLKAALDALIAWATPLVNDPAHI